MKLQILILPFFLVGCATFKTPMHQTVLEQIHEGDTKGHLIEVMGEPDGFHHAQNGADAYTYETSRETCEFVLQNDSVKEIACVKHRKTVCQTFGYTTTCR